MSHILDYFLGHPLMAIIDLLLFLLFFILVFNLIKLKRKVDRFYDAVSQLCKSYNIPFS